MTTVPYPHLPRFRKFLITFLLLLLLSPLAMSAVEERGNSATALGMGCSLASDPFNPAGRSVNPAAAAFADGFAFQIGFQRSYDLPELDRIHLNAIYPWQSRIIGLSVSSFGGDLYGERTVMLSISQRLTPWFAIGMAGGRAEVSIDRYGSDSAFLGDAGLLFYHRYVQLGIGGSNLVAQGMERYGSDPVPSQGVVSLRISPDQRFAITLESSVEKGLPPGFRFGGELRVYPNLLVRSGFDNRTERIHLGLGFLFDGLAVNGSYDHHPYLGWSKAFDLGWREQDRAVE